MDILKEDYLLVDLYGDEEKKYKIICKMNFFDTLIDLRTGREIYIKGMNDKSSNLNLCCSNKVRTISYEEVLEIIENFTEEDKEEYNEYLDNIEKKNKKVRKRKL